jgi:hypothetical protein
VLVEDLPHAERAVAAQIQLARGDSTDGHADGFESLAFVYRSFASLQELLHGRTREAFLNRYELLLL